MPLWNGVLRIVLQFQNFLNQETVLFLISYGHYVVLYLWNTRGCCRGIRCYDDEQVAVYGECVVPMRYVDWL